MADSRLFNAAQSGNVGELKAILEEDPLVLQRVSLSPTANTPLHVATLAGRSEFVKELARLEPSFAWELNGDGLSPLHMACATGHTGIVKELLALSPDLCFLKDKGGRTPLHYAAMKGRVRVIPKIHAKCPQAAKEVTARGETALHLAVKNNQFAALKVLLEELGDDGREMMKAKDSDGQTIKQIARARKQGQVLKLIAKEERPESQPTRDDGCISLQISSPDENETDNNNPDAASKKTNTNNEDVFSDVMEAVSNNTTNRTEKEEPAEAIFKSMSRRLDEMAPIVASLISSVTYSAGLSPPKTLWKENMKLDPECIGQMYGSTSPTPKLSDPSLLCPSRLFLAFISFNTAGFLSAILLIFLYRNTHLARMLLSTALIFMTMTYISLTITMAPNVLSFMIILGSTVGAFIFVFLFVALFRTVIKNIVRFIIMVMKKLGVL